MSSGPLARLGAWAEARPFLVAGAVMAAATLAVYAPFLSSLDKIYRYWDGPMYLFVAKTFYDVPASHPFDSLGHPPKYFASHLPLYPLLIRALTPLTLGDYPLAMLLATLASAVASALLFLKLLQESSLVRSPLWTAVLFAFLPPRWLLYHAVGATEPLFLCCAFGALLAFRRGRHGWVVACVLLASLTRITGILLVPAFGLAYLLRRDIKGLLLLPLSGLGLLLLFSYYAWVFGDFFAYSSWNIDRLGILRPTPFAGFLNSAEGANYRATELYFWIYLVYGAGTLALWRRRELFLYCLVFFLFGTFVFHMDATRYYVALAPFALLVAYDDVLGRPACRPLIALVVFLDYAYAWGLVVRNMAPRAVWDALVVFLGG